MFSKELVYKRHYCRPIVKGGRRLCVKGEHLRVTRSIKEIIMMHMKVEERIMRAFFGN